MFGNIGTINIPAVDIVSNKIIATFFFVFTYQIPKGTGSFDGRNVPVAVIPLGKCVEECCSWEEITTLRKS